MPKYDLSPPEGTRDFFAEDMKPRESVLHTVRDVFERFGFLPLETPAFERHTGGLLRRASIVVQSEANGLEARFLIVRVG
ncbi:MAG TPA: hypothetical protein VK129_01935, partial [Terriglobales bacterium]|nr:hypothetical protein [Terriglobales bacterium]